MMTGTPVSFQPVSPLARPSPVSENEIWAPMATRLNWIAKGAGLRIASLAVGALLTLVLLEGLLRLGGAAFQYRQDRANHQSLMQGADYRILCIGESTTAMGAPATYPRLLERDLMQRNPSQSFSVVNRGVPAITTDQIIRRLPRWLNKDRPHMVVAMMGVNDGRAKQVAYQEGPWPAFLHRFGSLRVAKFLALAWGSANSLMKAPRDFTLARGGWMARRRPRASPPPEANLREEFERDPTNPDALNALVKHLVLNGHRISEAVSLLEASLEAGHGNSMTAKLLQRCYAILAGIAVQHGQIDHAEQLVQRSVKFDLRAGYEDSAEGAGWLGLLRGLKGDSEASAQLARDARDSRMRNYNPMTRSSYAELKRMLDAQGVRLVAVQYPVRNVEPLKKLLDHAPNVVFVDNERVFKNILRTSPYSELFIDSFGGDFGHMTLAGRRVLAKNVATAIMASIGTDPVTQ
jgi:hypothetical protein